MKSELPAELEAGRMTEGPLASGVTDGFNGAFKVRQGNIWYYLIISDGGGWEHLSVHIVERGKTSRLPTWEEMCWLKDLVWREDEAVVQYHPAKTNYVNHHPWTLHLWRPIDIPLPVSPVRFV